MSLRINAGIAAAVFFAAAPAFAQGQPAGAIPVGPLMVYPGVDLAHGYDDNLFLRQTNVSSSSFTIISPYVRAEGRTGPHKFDFGLRIDDGRYHASSADNYFNYALTGNADIVYSGRASLKLNAVYRHAQEPRGTTDRTVSPVPDEYDYSGIDALFRYGAPGAQGRIEIDGGANTTRYTNNRAFTSVGDRDNLRLGGTFFWRVGPRTEVLMQAQRGETDYTLPGSTLDSTDRRLLFGVKWEATAATTGTAKFGRMKRDYESPGRQGFSANAWDVGVRWSPLTYSVFDFVSSKQTNESTGVGDAIVSENYGAAWNHAWSSRLRSQALASWRNDSFPGSVPLREDDTATFGMRVDYDFRRWLRLGAGLTHTERDSNLGGLNYKRNLLLLTIGATL